MSPSYAHGFPESRALYPRVSNGQDGPAAPLLDRTPDTQQVGRKRPAPEYSGQDLSPGTPTGSPVPTEVSDARGAQWLSSVYVQLVQWLERLRSLHPACKLIPTETMTLTLGVFREYVVLTDLSYQYAIMQPLVYQAVLGVCFWTSLKFLTTPGAVPNSKFMATAIGVPSNLLLEFEPEMLKVVGWNLLRICKDIGLSPAEPLEEEDY